MKNTYDTRKLAQRTLDIDHFRLPEGMGVGALRHTLAAGVRKHWGTICTDGAVDTVPANVKDFLGDADDPDDLLDANEDQPLPYGVLEMMYTYMHAAMGDNLAPGMPDPTPNEVDDYMADMLVDDLACLVAQHIRDDIIDQTGIDPDSWPENKGLSDWEVL